MGIAVILFIIYRSLPTSFIPNEDQGLLAVPYSLHNSASMSQTEEIGRLVNNYFFEHEAKNINTVLVVNGQNFSGSGPNLGMAFVSLKHWNERKGEANTASAIRERAQAYLQKTCQLKSW